MRSIAFLVLQGRQGRLNYRQFVGAAQSACEWIRQASARGKYHGGNLCVLKGSNMKNEMSCKECGAPLASVGAKFCSSCGKALDQPSSLVTAAVTASRGNADEFACKGTATENTLDEHDRESTLAASSGLLANGVVYFVAYLVVAIPTYILPYFGSNSSVMNTIGAASGLGALPQFWFHLIALYLLVVLAWLRGGHINKQWLAVLPVLAGIFDMVPGFSLIPLLPTIFHVLAMILGVRGQVVAGLEPTANKRRLQVSGVGLAALAVLTFSNVSSFFRTAENAPWMQSKSRPQQQAGQRPAPTQPAPASLATRPDAPDPALALAITPVDPSGTTITTGGFAGLKVGHSREQVQEFFQNSLTRVPHCSESEYEIVAPLGTANIHIDLIKGQVVAFEVSGGNYRTRSGLQVGDPEEKVIELYGSDRSFERQTRVEPAPQNEYWIGRSSATSMRIIVDQGKVRGILFGSSRIVPLLWTPC